MSEIFDAKTIDAAREVFRNDTGGWEAIFAAAETSLRDRGLLRDGQGYHDADGGEAWDATTGGFREPGGFSVVIIKKPTP